MWEGAVTLGFDVEPGAAELERIADAYTARNCGVRPNVRVVEGLRIPACVNASEPVCEDF